MSLCLGSARASSQSYGLDSAPPFAAYLNGKFPTLSSNSVATLATKNAFPNLSLNELMFLTPYPRSNDLAIVTKPGRIYRFENKESVTNAGLQPILDISSQVFNYNDSGMTGLVFHPEFGLASSANRGYIYVTYKWRPNPAGSVDAEYGYIRLSRFTVPDGQTAADPKSEQILVQNFDRQPWHDAGCLLFGPEGYLYFSIGDEGGGNDEYNVTQKINGRLHSGMFRIDVDRVSARSHAIRRQPQAHPGLPAGWPASYTANYNVPNDNPFVNPNGSVLEEYYALGLRNPYRFSQDPVTGKIWIGDVGQSTREEVNILQAGANYGWAFREGTVAGPQAPPASIIGTLKEPIWDYGRDQGGCAIGGYVYRGHELAAELTGKYIFTDWVSHRIYALTTSGETFESMEDLGSVPGPRSCGLDANGEIYFLTDSQILKLTRQTVGAPGPPALLSQTGAFTDLATLTPSTGFIPYDVNSPFWSDNAAKKRWMAVPNDGTPDTPQERITFSANSEWEFPSGTVFVKHFELPIDDRNPALTQRLETRFLVIDQNGGSYGVTYRWRADGSDANLLTTGASQDYTIATAGGGTRSQTWSFPSRLDCTSCHNSNSKHVLGAKTYQLNRDLRYPVTGRTDNQLRTLAHVGLLSGDLFSEVQIPEYPRARGLTETDASLEIRARSYLDSNCSHCHRPGGVRASFDARFTTPLAEQNLIHGMPGDKINGPSDRYIRPRDLTHSLTYERANRVGPLQMPPLAKNVVDTAAMEVIAAWINSLNPAPSVVLSRTPSTTSAVVSGRFSIQAQFSEDVSMINAGMFSLENATVTSVSGSGSLYQAVVQPQPEASIAVQFAEGRVAAGPYGNYASNTLELTYDSLAADLETWLRFNEGSSRLAGDSSGFGNDGTLVNMPANALVPGINGSACHFDGADDYVSIANQTASDFTLSCWIRSTQKFPTTTQTYGGTGIIWSDVGGGAADFILGATRSETGVNRLSFFTGILEMSVNGTVPINTGKWVHIAATRNGTTGKMKIYVDGLLEGTATGTTGLLHANSRIHIGGNTLDGRYFSGDIDDVRIYSRALGGAEISTLSTLTRPRENYSAWAATNGVTGGAAADANQDGVPNGIAYFMGETGSITPPSIVPNDNGTYTIAWDNGGNIPSSAYGSKFFVETSSDLVTWTEVGASDLKSNTAREVSYTIPPGTVERKTFVRLKVIVD
ncbi:MAG: PQQ-dependent sugar dehydrogenase [Akkermansiaceae bacterium]|nr:PQQ-dependent sugar dehydrogenase [Akkermansiaceae bacterium]